MAGLTHSNDTTGKDKKANGFRHFFNSHMSGAALAPILAKNYGANRKAYHLTADYNWGYTTEEAVRESTEAQGWETVAAVKTPLAQFSLVCVKRKQTVRTLKSLFHCTLA